MCRDKLQECLITTQSIDCLIHVPFGSRASGYSCFADQALNARIILIADEHRTFPMMLPEYHEKGRMLSNPERVTLLPFMETKIYLEYVIQYVEKNDYQRYILAAHHDEVSYITKKLRAHGRICISTITSNYYDPDITNFWKRSRTRFQILQFMR